jgi:hypothetical protein
MPDHLALDETCKTNSDRNLEKMGLQKPARGLAVYERSTRISATRVKNT